MAEIRFCAGLIPAGGASEIRDGEYLWQWSGLEIRLHVFPRSTIPQKQFIIVIIIIFRGEMQGDMYTLKWKMKIWMWRRKTVGNCVRFQQKISDFTISFDCKRTIATEHNLQKQRIKHRKFGLFWCLLSFFLAVFQQ